MSLIPVIDGCCRGCLMNGVGGGEMGRVWFGGVEVIVYICGVNRFLGE